MVHYWRCINSLLYYLLTSIPMGYACKFVVFGICHLIKSFFPILIECNMGSTSQRHRVISFIPQFIFIPLFFRFPLSFKPEVCLSFNKIILVKESPSP